MIIGYLSILSTRDRFPYGRLSELAGDAGNELRFVRETDDTPQAMHLAWAHLRGILNDADAFFMPNDYPLLLEEYARLLHDRIRSGARVLVRLNVNSLDHQNAFLASYDLTGTTVRIRSQSTPLIRLERTPDHYRDSRLFAGVDEVQIQHPNAVWYGGDSLPVLVADDRYLTVDGDSDLPSNWNARELACVAAWQGTGGGGVLAMSGGYFEDPYGGVTGIEWPGIEVNRQFATNVLQYLAEGRSSDTPEDHCKKVEINLTDFVFGTLLASASHWWNTLVPESIQQKCAHRHRQEEGRFPVEAYCDLIDLKTIIEKNWPLFEFHVRAVVGAEGKHKCLKWLSKLNELRRLVGHPLKRHVAGYTFSAEDQILLREANDFARRLRIRLFASKTTSG